MIKNIQSKENFIDVLAITSEQDSPTSNAPQGSAVEWTLVTALEVVLNAFTFSLTSIIFKDEAEAPLAYLRNRLQMTDVQIIFLTLLINEEEMVSWKNVCEFLGCSRLQLMKYKSAMDELVDKRWVRRKKINSFGTQKEGFELEKGVIEALGNNEVFVPEKIDGFSEQDFVNKMSLHLKKHLKTPFRVDYEEESNWLLSFSKANPQLPLCQYVNEQISSDYNKVLLMLFIAKYAFSGIWDDESLDSEFFEDFFPDSYCFSVLIDEMISGTHPFFKEGLVDYACENGIANTSKYLLTSKAKQMFLSNYVVRTVKSQSGNNMLKSHTSIKEKTLYYNREDEHQINRLVSIFQQEYFLEMQNRLEQTGMRRGFACLFYGAPGTGKTETVLQIARKTGREIMMVDIASIKDKFVGESEKNLKQVFTTYRQLCEEMEVKPILFFNEADAIINKRLEDTEHSVDMMCNAMQNILLQEIEDFDGILIATTNLVSTLDPAFERRFIFKVEFHKPTPEVKAKIWVSMLPSLTEEEALTLASRYDFSGGQIENVARKRAVEYILSGVDPSFAEIESYCKNELIVQKKTVKPISGFAV